MNAEKRKRGFWGEILRRLRKNDSRLRLKRVRRLRRWLVEGGGLECYGERKTFTARSFYGAIRNIERETRMHGLDSLKGIEPFLQACIDDFIHNFRQYDSLNDKIYQINPDRYLHTKSIDMILQKQLKLICTNEEIAGQIAEINAKAIEMVALSKVCIELGNEAEPQLHSIDDIKLCNEALDKALQEIKGHET